MAVSSRTKVNIYLLDKKGSRKNKAMAKGNDRSKRFTMNYMDLVNPKQRSIKRVSRETYRRGNEVTHPLGHMVNILNVLDYLIARAVDDMGLEGVCGSQQWRDMIQSRNAFSNALDYGTGIGNCPD